MILDGLFAELATGLVGTAIIALVGWIGVSIKNRQLNRRYPVGGAYASSYEDNNGGKKVTIKALAQLHQKGRRITGVSCNLSDSRKWNLEAQIARGGRIYGTYDAVDPHDDGLGGFFLEIRGSKELSGVWAGYDSVSKCAEAGKYHFRRLTDIVIRPMQALDTAAALAVLGEELGEKYVRREQLSLYVGSSSDQHALVATDTSGNVVGAITGEQLLDSEFDDVLPAGAARLIKERIPSLQFNCVGLLRSLVVASAAKGQGIGTRLATAMIDRLFADGATCILTIGWTDPGGCHIKGLVEGLGFIEVAAVPEYWREDSLKKGYDCPNCGSPCLCEGRIFLARRSDIRTGKG